MDDITKDLELLGLAAKAAGDINFRFDGHSFVCVIGISEALGCDVMREWNPLLDDGDALRLAISLKMTVRVFDHLSDAQAPNHASCQVVSCDAADIDARTRLAIVRAAAEIGKAMQ